jgi:hypothetical protein
MRTHAKEVRRGNARSRIHALSMLSRMVSHQEAKHSDNRQTISISAEIILVVGVNLHTSEVCCVFDVCSVSMKNAYARR